MSISSSLSNALSGLTAASRAAEIVSSNLANSLTDGYARRRLDLSSQSTGGVGGGVQIDGVARLVDRGVLADRRISDANLGFADTSVAFFRNLERVMGVPGDPGTLTDRLTQLETSLIAASIQPSSEQRLDAVGQAFLGIAAELNRLTDSIQTDRERADASIAANVDELNASLALIDKLSDDITTIRISGADISALLDQRQLAIDAVSKIIPVQEVSRDNNQIALVSAGGGTLYDSQPAIFSFEKTSTITGELSVINGLGHLKFNGTSVNFLENNPFDGGILEGHFDVRDEFAVQAQTELDEIAASLIDRFQGDDVDPTQTDDVLGIPALGIFTDGGQAFSSGNEAGVAGRISINELVDVSQDGKSQLFRDGLYDEGGSELGDPTQIQNWLGALSTQLSDSALAEATDVFSKIGSRRLISERNFSFENARYETLKQAELSDGVDTDQEMQNLLLIEQAYSANAKVIQTVDEMMQTLLRLGS